MAKYKKKSIARKKVEAGVRSAWRHNRKRAADRRKLSQKVRAQQRGSVERGPTFSDRHWRLADWKDSVSLRGHLWLDKRDLRSGVLTNDELDSFMDFDGSLEEWRAQALAARRARYQAQQLSNRGGDRAPLAMVYGGAPGALPRIKHTGFTPPKPRVVRESQVMRPVEVKPRQPVRRRRRNHIEKVAASWAPQLNENARKAMAADANLSSAADSVRSFAEQFPETRSQLHDHLGKMAEFGKHYSSAMETFVAVLRQGNGEDNPGLPQEVLQHMAPLAEVGDQIARACGATVAAWEDYFADAIRVARDEHTPSKAALTS